MVRVILGPGLKMLPDPGRRSTRADGDLLLWCPVVVAQLATLCFCRLIGGVLDGHS